MDYTQYGALGAMVVGLVVALKILWSYLKKREEVHAKERSEMIKVIKEITDKNDLTAQETNKVVRETGGILFGLKSLLENQNRK